MSRWSRMLWIHAAWLFFIASYAAAQESAETITFGSAEEAVREAKRTGMPLVVFGMSDTCHRCQALHRYVTQDETMQPLMAQYVSTIVPFGGREFSEMYNKIVQEDRELPIASGIGAPSAFVFTSRGKLVYAGPNQANGIPPGEEFREVILQGIEANESSGRKRSKPADDDELSTASAGDTTDTATATKPSRELARSWTSKNGKFSLRARWVSHDGETVQLQKVDGSIIEVEIALLSNEDQHYLDAKQRPVAAGDSSDTAPETE